MLTLFGWPDKAPVHEYRKKRDGLREDSESSSQGGHSRIPCDTNFMGYSAFLAMRGNKKEGEDISPSGFYPLFSSSLFRVDML